MSTAMLSGTKEEAAAAADDDDVITFGPSPGDVTLSGPSRLRRRSSRRDLS
jgi:hypothetical protein